MSKRDKRTARAKQKRKEAREHRSAGNRTHRAPVQSQDQIRTDKRPW